MFIRIYSRYLKHYIIFKLSSLAVIIFFCSSMKIHRCAIENLVKFFLKKLLTFKKLVCAQKMQEYVFYTLMFLKKFSKVRTCHFSVVNLTVLTALHSLYALTRYARDKKVSTTHEKVKNPTEIYVLLLFF